MSSTIELTNSLLKGIMSDAMIGRNKGIGDLNNVDAPAGFYRTDPSTLNMPSGVFLYGMVSVEKMTYGTSVFIWQRYLSNHGEFLYRWCWANVWANWWKVAATEILP